MQRVLLTSVVVTLLLTSCESRMVPAHKEPAAASGGEGGGAESGKTPGAKAQVGSHSNDHSRHQRGKIFAAQWFGPKPPFQEQSWTVEGGWKATQEEAIDDALKAAQGKVTAFLWEESPSSKWLPPTSFIKSELVRDMPADMEKVFEDQKQNPGEIRINRHRAYEEIREFDSPIAPKAAHRVRLNVSITPEAWGKIQREQLNDLQRYRNAIMKERMLFLAKILAGLVALLATVAGYIRLDEWSKGYYTNWLRLAAVGCAGAVVAAGWWLFLAN